MPKKPTGKTQKGLLRSTEWDQFAIENVFHSKTSIRILLFKKLHIDIKKNKNKTHHLKTNTFLLECTMVKIDILCSYVENIKM